MKKRITVLLLLLVTTHRVAAQEWLDQVGESLRLQSPDRRYRIDLSGLADVEAYYIDQRPPGLLFEDDDFVNPRLSLFLDAQFGEHLYSFVQLRVDRGFDPYSGVWDARFDEYLLRYRPFEDARFSIQVGKFATVVGNWVQRHDSWHNPFITAPLPYENVTAVADVNVTPTANAFLVRRDAPDNKVAWLPVLWGPAYTTGISVFGAWERFDYAFEFKNASVSSRPAVWDARDLGWENPTVSGRLGFRPDAAWNFGASFSTGTYLQPDAELIPAFPAGREIGDFLQTTVAFDASFAWRRWQIWSEVFLSRFEVPNVGNADTLAYYIEAKYKFSTRWFAAVRWNQQFFADVRNNAGMSTPWDRDVYRIDTAVGVRLTRHIQAKAQYSYTHHDSTLQQGEQLVAGQLTVKF
jgi:hypothetical protein